MKNFSSNASYRKAVAQAQELVASGFQANVCTAFANPEISDEFFVTERVHGFYNVIHSYYPKGWSQNADLQPSEDECQIAYGL
jgi:hypothetical protein